MRASRIGAILLMLLMLLPATANAVPPLPSTFWGVFTMNGARVSLSAELTAYVGDVPCGRARLFPYEGATGYSVSVNGDDPETPGKEGGVNGDVIHFRLNGVPLAATAVWDGGDVEKVDLLETSPHRLTAKERLSLPVLGNDFWPAAPDAN